MHTGTMKCIGLGYCAENKPLDSHDVQIIPYEWLNLKDGELGTLTTAMLSSGVDLDEAFYTSKIEIGDTVRATFLQQTNLDTSPDVRRGEKVWLFQQGDADRYYWVSTGMDDDQRRLETVRWRWSDLPENSDEALDDSNTYWHEVSTHKGLVTFKTSNRNGEHVIYTAQFNCKDGQYTVKDDKENTIQIDSRANTIWLINQEQSKVEINRTEIHIEAIDKLSATTKDMYLKAANVFIEATDFHVKAPNIYLDGTIQAGPILTERIQGPVLAEPLMLKGLAPVPPVQPYPGDAAANPLPIPRTSD